MTSKKKKASSVHKTEHKEVKETKKDSSIMPKDQNAWISAAIFILVGLIIGALISYGAVVAMGPQDSSGNNLVNVEELKLKVQDYVNTNLVLDDTIIATIISAEKISDGLYELSFVVEQNGVEVGDGSIFATNDLLILGTKFDMNENINNDDVPVPNGDLVKQDVPDAELYIFSYCPAGSATLDTFVEAADALKETANVRVRFFSDMHGAHERQQNLTMECIQEVEPTKFWDYAKDYYETVYATCESGRSTDCDKTEATTLMEAKGIDANAVYACVDTIGEDLYAEDIALAGNLQLQYSPSVVVNGKYFGSADRSPEGIKNLVCSGYTTAPDLCNVALDEEVVNSGSC